jgi:serine O-acetyltransferase
MMRTSLARADLEAYILRLLANHLPDGYIRSDSSGALAFTKALDRVEHCFTHIHRKYYNERGAPHFDHLNSDHMATLLYFFANTVWRDGGDLGLATRLFYLNKILHGLDLFYSVTLPDIFILVHPVGTVLGNARYQDYLVIYQNCTVGAVTKSYPSFGLGTILYSRSTVLGDCKLGDDVIVAANAMIIDREVPSSTVVIGQPPYNRFIASKQSVKARCFDPLVVVAGSEQL